jgi:hypothetical protein
MLVPVRAAAAGCAFDSVSFSAKSPKRQSAELLAALHDPSSLNGDQKCLFAAIKAVGQRRIVAAIPDLVKLIYLRENLWWEDTPDQFHPITTMSRFPAAGALFQIGEASLPALLQIMQEHDPGSLEADIASDAVMTIFRENRAEGVKSMRAAASKAASKEAKDRLSLAADRAQKKWVR